MFKNKLSNTNKRVFPESMQVPESEGMTDTRPGKVRRSEDIPTIPAKVEKHLEKSRLIEIGCAAMCGVTMLATLAIAFKPVPDMAVYEDGSTKRLRPLEANSQTEAQRVFEVTSKRYANLYTWFGTRVDPDDPTQRVMIENKKVKVPYDEGSKSGSEGYVPETVWEERHFLADEIMMPTMRSIAKIISQDTNNVIWRNGTSPMSVGYRLQYKNGSPSFPEEVESGKWKMIVNAVIERWSPLIDNVLTISRAPLQYVDMELYVRRTGRHSGQIPNRFGVDELAYGKKDGIEIYFTRPFKPQEQGPPEVN
jgi:hypothetical protein